MRTIDWKLPVRGDASRNPAAIQPALPLTVLRKDRPSSLGYCVEIESGETDPAHRQRYLYSIDGYPDTGGPWLENYVP